MRASDLVPGRAMRVLERDALVYRRQWMIFLSGLLEPLLFLLSIGIGVGGLVGKVPGPGGDLVPYREFVAPGLLAVSAMNGAVLDTTFMFFIKLKYWGTFETMLSTPLTPGDVVVGAVLWSVVRGAVYSACFLVTMAVLGLTPSPMAILALPAAILVCWAFAGAGAGGAAFMRSYFDFDFVNAVIIPSFLFSAVFFPLSRYPEWLQRIVQVTPLYQGVALCRDLTFGHIELASLGHAVYLVAMGAAGLAVASRRLVIRLTP
ncbi:MAG TPA: ABC transporter permease [Acidimicrobiales bacterium]